MDTESRSRKSSSGNVEEYQVAMLGCTGVGKTSLVMRYTKNAFDPRYTPTLLDNIYYKFSFNGRTGIMKILDPSGMDGFDSLFDQYIEVSQGFLVVLSKTEADSLKKAQDIIKKIRVIHSNDPKIVIVANKCDLVSEFEISTEDLEKLASASNCTFYETSCLLNINVQSSYSHLVPCST